MAAMPLDELQYFVEDNGHGCLDGRKHNIFLTASEDIWIQDFDTLQAVTASTAVTQ